MPWWSSGADPKWSPPRAQRPGAGRDKLRERLWEILEDDNRDEWFAALKLQIPARAAGRFLDGDDALTPDELRAIASFVDEFGRAMETNRLVRRPPWAAS
jgi:hypothetical protein